MTDSNPFFEAFSNTEDDVVVPETTEKSESTTPASPIFTMESNPFESTTFTSNTNNNNSSNQTKKYYIRDNYWFINMKLYKKGKLEEGEAPYITLSFNSQYDNLRIVFLNPGPDAFTGNAIVRSKCKVVTTANIFAETCEALLYYYDRSEEKPVSWNSLERLIQSDSGWKPNSTKFELDKKNNRITIYTSPSNNNGKNQIFKFTFEDYQTKGFLNVCEFMRKEAWVISNMGQFLINN